MTNYERLSLAYLAAIADGVGYLTEVINPLSPRHGAADAERVGEWRDHLAQLRTEMLAVLQDSEAPA